MKIKDLKTKKVVNELKLGSFGLGDYGSAMLKQTFGQGGGLTKQDLMTQNIYIRNFVSNALSNLNNAVKSGLVDVKKAEPRVATAKDLDQTYNTMQPGDLGDFDLKDKMAQQAQVRKDQEIANVANARMAAAASSPTNPEVTAAVDARMQRAAQAKQAQTPGPSSVDDKVDKSAAQRGPETSAIPQNTDPRNRFTAQQKKEPKQKFTGQVGVDESTYRHLNALFEAILETVMPQQSDTYSIKDYLKTVWLPNYLKGVNWKPNEQKIDQILQQVQDTYAKDSGKAALNQLASLSFSITPRTTGKSKKPVGNRQQQQPTQQQQQPTQQQQQQQQSQPAQKKKFEGPVATWGGVKYRKTQKGWVDKQGRAADTATAKILDQAITKSQEEPPNPSGPAATATAGPASGAAQQDDALPSNVTPIRRNKVA